MERAWSRDQLVTTGAFSACRHPLYAAWILFLLPGLALLTQSWPMILTPLVAYAAFKLAIHEEDHYLRRRFGRRYLDYCATVRELIPIPRR